MGVETALIAAAVATAGSAGYAAHETKQQEKKAEKAQANAEKQAQATIEERKQKIAGMKTRLFSTEGGFAGEEVEDNKLLGN